MSMKWLMSVWKKDGDSLQDYTYPYSETHGELNPVDKQEEMYYNKKHKKAMQEPIQDPTEKIRKAGY